MDKKTRMIKIKESLHLIWEKVYPFLRVIHQWRKRIWKKYQVNKVLLLLGLTAILIGSVYLFYLAKSAKVGALMDGLKQSTVIYDQNNEEAGKLFGQKGSYVELDQISPYIQDAVISTEDRRFYAHPGYDLKGIVRVALKSVTSGRISGGGSTITQQLAKNAYLTLDQTFSRKARELFLAIEIEKEYSKDEILTMYLNNSYFGNGVWGVEDAAQKYFGVSAAEVTPGEAATLIGILNGPSIYNPLDSLENATNKRDTILQSMVENNKLAQEEADAQAAIDLSALLYDGYTGGNDDYRYPYYFDAVVDEIVTEYKIKEEDLLNKGYKIYTELDQNYQVAMEQTYANDQLFPPNAADGAMVQSGSVAVDPKTGGVRAVVGGRGEHVYRGFNFATQTKRSPGSSLKPIAVYTPALEAGYKPNSLLEDKPQSYYPAENYSRMYAGEVPMYQALGESLNLPAVWLLHQIGLEKGFEKAQAFGIPLAKEDRYYGLALGGLKTGVSPLTMAQAYSPFANEGKQAKTHFVTKILDSTGAVIVDNTQAKTEAIITANVANEITSMLLGVFSSGSGVNAQPYGFQMAGKTGTTETNFDSNKTNDQWVVGYTPDVVLATWLGFEQSSAQHYLEGSSATYASTVFNQQASQILPLTKQTPFTIADAYATNGEVKTTAEVTQESEWTEDVKEKVEERAKTIGGQIKDGIDKTADRMKQFLQRFWE